MEKRERKKEQPESANESMVMPQLSQAGKLANTIKTLLVGNRIGPKGRLIDVNLTEVAKTLTSEEKIAFLCQRMNDIAVSNEQANPALSAQAASASDALQAALANRIDNAYVLNVIDGVVFGNETAKYALDKVMEAYHRKQQHDAASQVSENDKSGLGSIIADRHAQHGFLGVGRASNSMDISGVIFPRGFSGRKKTGQYVVKVDVDFFDKVLSTKVQNILKGTRGVESSFCISHKATLRGDIYKVIFSKKGAVKKLIDALNTLEHDWSNAAEDAADAAVKKR